MDNKKSFYQKSAELAATKNFPLVAYRDFNQASNWGVGETEMRPQAVAFSLLESRSDYDYAYKSGLTRLEKLVADGNMTAVNELLPKLEQQFAVYCKIVTLARAYQAQGGIIKCCDDNGIHATLGGKWTQLSISAESGVFNLKMPLACKSTEIQAGDWSSINRWLLWASRLLRDAKVRCKKATQHQPAPAGIGHIKPNLLDEVRAKI